MSNPNPSSPDARHIALDLLQAVLVRLRLLDEAFEAEHSIRDLEDRDRAFLRLLVATTLRRLGQIDNLLARCLDKPLPLKAARAYDVLRLGACQLLFLDTAPHAAISTSVNLLKRTALGGYAGLVNAVLRRLDREGRQWVAEQDAASLNTPAWLWRSWTNAYGEDTARAIATAHLREAPTDFTTAADPTIWAELLDGEIMPTGSIRRTSGGDITRLPGFDEAAWWVQDMAAALPVKLLGDVKDLRIGDLCAAPGGKALQLAAAGAHVTAVDRSAPRMRRLTANMERLGLEADVVEADATSWRPETPFDGVLLDAPCSATGTLRRHPDGLWLKKPNDVAKLSALQTRLLAAAGHMVRPGGTLVYCVCSLEAEEGPNQVEAWLASGAPFTRKPVLPEEIGGLGELVTAQGDIRSFPHHLAEKGGMDAFYVARLVRNLES